MKPIGYFVLINSDYADTIAFDKTTALEIAQKLNPKAVKKLNREYSERLSASELSRILAFDHDETRVETLDRVRTELDAHWDRLGFDEKPKPTGLLRAEA